MADAGDFAGGALPSGQVSFTPGATSKTITLQIAGDAKVESDEGFTVALSNASGSTVISNPHAEGVILNDDLRWFDS